MVLDTNVLLSGIAYPASIPGRLLAAWRAGSLDVFLSAYILEELRRVMPRLAHRHGLTSAEVDCLVDSLFIQVDLVEPEMAPVIALRDAADLAVLGTLIAAGQVGGACYLVTGDKDLLALAASYPIVTPATFWANHGSDGL
mgnify:CR=1 FL=1